MLYIMCIGAKLQYKPLYIHCKFILGITTFMQLHSNFTEDIKIKWLHYFFSGVYNHAMEQARSKGTCSQGCDS